MVRTELLDTTGMQTKTKKKKVFAIKTNFSVTEKKM